MATDRADLAVVKRIVYDNLGVTNQSSGYGNLQTNERYLTGYIDDAIAMADIQTMKLLLKQKQFHLTGEYWTTLAIPNGYRMTLPEHDAILGVYYYTSTTGVDAKAQPVSRDIFEMISQAGIFDITTYGGYYNIQDGEIQLIGKSVYRTKSFVVTPIVGPTWTQVEAIGHTFAADDPVYFVTDGGALPSPFVENTVYYIKSPVTDMFSLSLTAGGAVVTGSSDWDGNLSVQSTNQQIGYLKYIKLNHESTLSTLYSPENLEGALANFASGYLLMKRGDQPQQASFYTGLYQQEMQALLSPISDMSKDVEQ